jgi:hypothetical protein
MTNVAQRIGRGVIKGDISDTAWKELKIYKNLS